jgi:hypothetical protein
VNGRLGRLIVLIPALIGIGCVAAFSPGAPSYPSWVTSPPADNASSLYGVGESPNREAAKHAALAAIAGRLATQVRSSMSIEQRQDPSGFSEELESHVNTRVKDTGLSHFEVQEAVKVGPRWVVLVRVSRPDLIAANLTALRESDHALQQQMQRLEAQSDLARYLASRSVLERIQKSRANIAILHSVSSDFEGRPELKRYLGYEDVLARSRYRLRARVTANETALTLAEQLTSQLTQDGLSARIGTATPGAVTVTLDGEARRRERYGDKEVRLIVSIKTLDDTGGDFANLERRAVATSAHSYEDALARATEALARECAKLGATACLGWRSPEAGR